VKIINNENKTNINCDKGVLEKHPQTIDNTEILISRFLHI